MIHSEIHNLLTYHLAWCLGALAILAFGLVSTIRGWNVGVALTFIAAVAYAIFT